MTFDFDNPQPMAVLMEAIRQEAAGETVTDGDSVDMAACMLAAKSFVTAGLTPEQAVAALDRDHAVRLSYEPATGALSISLEFADGDTEITVAEERS